MGHNVFVALLVALCITIAATSPLEKRSVEVSWADSLRVRVC